MADDHVIDGNTPFKEALKTKSRARRKALRDALPLVSPHPPRNDLVPRLELVHLAPSELIISKRNVRRLDPEHLHAVAGGISVFGFSEPPIIDDEGRVLNGVVRVEAAKLLSIPSIPCIVASHLSASEKRLLRLALNRLQERGGWDLAELKLELEELILEDAPITLSGFDMAEIDQILLDDEPAVVEVGPLEPDADLPAIARPGDIFELGEHRVGCGDATDTAFLRAVIGPEMARLLLTDEPFNVPIKGHVTKGDHREFPMASGEMSDAEFCTFNEAWMATALPYLLDGGLLGTFIDWRGHPTIHTAAVQQGLAPINLIVWAKTNAGLGSFYRSQHELLPLFKKGDAPHVNNVNLGKKGRWRSNLWTCPGASSIGSGARKGLRDHPIVKPVTLLEDALLDMTMRGDIVLDPFLGSGSTLIAAEKTGRRCRGVELDPRYVDVILRRYQAVTGVQATLMSNSLHICGAN